MKILTKKDWNYKFTCSGCASELEAEESDVKRGSFGSMGDYSTEYYMLCPICGKYEFPEWKKLPPSIKFGKKTG